MKDPVRILAWPPADGRGMHPREWLVTNGLGGFASSTVGGANTRRYHGLLIGALPAPHGRQVVLRGIEERVNFPDGSSEILSDASGDDGNHAPFLREFRLELGLPVWSFEVRGHRIEKRIVMPHFHNTVCVIYRQPASAERLAISVRPFLHLTAMEKDVNAPHPEPYRIEVVGARDEIHPHDSDLPPLRMRVTADSPFVLAERRTETRYPIEQERGYPDTGSLWSPGHYEIALDGDPTTFLASVEGWDVIDAVDPIETLDTERQRRRDLLAAAPEDVREGVGAELVLAADQFVIAPAARQRDMVAGRASGDEARTIIAGYHWFTDWGRDTMISLEGLMLETGRTVDAGSILRTFAHHIRDGLIPNLFPEGKTEGLYHTADATLWFFHALSRYVVATCDHATLHRLLPQLVDVAHAHLRGTRFGIHVDPEDGLLCQGAEGYQLTWMDAKVEDWVVTPRRGKAVEINALWFNALCLLEGWLREEQRGEEADEFATHAERAKRSFNAKFWANGRLRDVVDGEGGDDDACRPNQLLAISLEHPILEEDKFADVLRVVREKLATPGGLRSLAPDDPAYQPTYDGDRRARDAAYHQGTVWAWLAGPYVDAWLKVEPQARDEARRYLDHLAEHLNEGCVGSISEVFDAEAPFTPRGCVAQAWSVAEMLRAYRKTRNS